MWHGESVSERSSSSRQQPLALQKLLGHFHSEACCTPCTALTCATPNCRCLQQPRVQQRERRPRSQPSCGTPTAVQAACWPKNQGATRLQWAHPTPAGALQWQACCSIAGQRCMEDLCPGIRARGPRAVQQRLELGLGRCLARAGTAAGAASTHREAAAATGLGRCGA
jgi:hypothetical protein